MIRFFDFFFSIVGLIVLLPVFAAVALLIVADSRGGVFYRQTRVGRKGVDFRLYKFRTMSKGSDRQGLITVGARDSRITGVGYYLRKYKVDELPQLINVLKGEMSIVGPRPEVREYANLYSEEQRRVLSVRPGITDYASIEFIDENDMLEKVENPKRLYIEEIMPLKIKYSMKYIDCYCLKEYFRVIMLTVLKIVRL